MPGGSFDVDQKRGELDDLKEKASSPDLWEDPRRATEVNRKLARHTQLVDQVDRLAGILADAAIFLEMAADEDDRAAEAEVAADLAAAQAELAELEVKSLFFGEYDDHTAIFSIHAGAGGVDAQDWAEMLLRMYLRFLDERASSRPPSPSRGSSPTAFSRGSGACIDWFGSVPSTPRPGDILPSPAST